MVIPATTLRVCLFILIGGVLLCTCSRPENPVLVRFDSDSITVQDLQLAYRMERAFLEELPSKRSVEEEIEIKKKIIEDLINHRLLLNEARAKGITIDAAALREYLEKLRQGYSESDFIEQLAKRGLTLREWESAQQEKYLIQTWIRSEVLSRIQLGTDEMKEYYRKNADQFVQPEQLRALHIIVKTRKEAEEVLGRLKAGEDFKALSREYSFGPEAEEGGDLGYFTRVDYPKVFTESCFKLKKGRTSEIVSSDYGFHIFKVIDRKGRTKRRFREVMPEIHRVLMGQKVQAMIQETLDKLRQASSISIHLSTLKEVSL